MSDNPYQQPPPGQPQQNPYGTPQGQPPGQQAAGGPGQGGPGQNPYQPPNNMGGMGGGNFNDMGHPQAGQIPGIVIAGFILSFLCSLVGLILCIIGLQEAKARNAGVGLATAGIVISIISMIAGVAIQLGNM